MDASVLAGASDFSLSLGRFAGSSLFLALAVFTVFCDSLWSPRFVGRARLVGQLVVGLVVVLLTVLWVFRVVPDVLAVVGLVAVLGGAWVILWRMGGMGEGDSERDRPVSTDGRQDDE